MDDAASAESFGRAGRIAENRFAALLDAAVDPVVVIDPRGRILRFNLAAEGAFGYQACEVVGLDVGVLVPALQRAAHAAYLERYQRSGQPTVIGRQREVEACRKDGSTFPVELSVGEFHDGYDHGFVGIVRDITRRKRQQQAIRQTSEELRLIFENAPTAITITDIHGHILHVNRACTALLGYTPQELRCVRHTDLIAEEDRPALREQYRSLRDAATRFERDVQYRTGDGGRLFARLTADVARDDSGTPLLMICEILDRTALFAAEREIEEIRARLAHVNRIGTLGEMVSGIAHEVNQPLTAVTTYVGAARRLALGRDHATPDLVDILDKIAVQAERAAQVIRGLRNLTRRRPTTQSAQDGNALVREVVRLFEFELRGRGVRLNLSLAERLPQVICDRVQVQQVILNLVRNALEALDGVSGQTEVTIGTRLVNGRVEISVSDTGPGMSEESVEHLFEPFFTTKPHGMGLGLSICNSIAAAHGSELAYCRNVSGGARLSMTLPVDAPS